MTVRVIGASSESCWYSEMIGEVFNVFLIPTHQYVFFTASSFFYPKDIEQVKDVEGLLPQLIGFGQA